MKDEIEQFKRENGNVTYTVKELIGAANVKLDKLSDKLDKKASKTMVWKLAGAFLTLVVALGVARLI